MGDAPIEAVSIAEHIRAQLSDLTPSERRVARALLTGSPTAGLESSRRLAAVAGVSGPTVSRFVQRLGFDNYAAFQQAMRDDVTARMLSPIEVYRQHAPAGPGRDLLRDSADALGQALEASMREVAPESLRRAAELLADPKRQVVTAGGWFSHVLAEHLAALLRHFRPQVRSVAAASMERATTVADVNRRDVVVLFDYRRYERDTLDLATAVHRRGASLVLFTDPWLSPIADLAEVTLAARVSGPAPFESLVPTLALVETVVASVAEVLGENGARHFERFTAIADDWVRPWPPAAP